MQLKCEQVQELLSSFYDGELDQARSEEVHQHVLQCSDCRYELECFCQLSSLVGFATTPAPAAEGWNRLAARLDEPAAQPVAQPVAELAGSSLAAQATAPLSSSWSSRWPRGQMAWSLALALAASLLVMAVVRQPMRPVVRQADSGQNSDNRSAGSAPVVLDYAAIIEQEATQPKLALASVSDQFDGQEVAADNAQQELGYRPAVLVGLPAGTHVVSTRLLKLPSCHCAGGQCQCGPQGCNCAACLCQRDDGSQFLVFEHCKTQDVSFGSLQPQLASSDSQQVQFFKTDKQLAVSWSPGARRLTAIGLKDRAEAESLIAALDRS
ncbi:MAG: anti-sigma factor family protein [Aureliella sp.]